jgi:hypothetical protein
VFKYAELREQRARQRESSDLYYVRRCESVWTSGVSHEFYLIIYECICALSLCGED